ncbi:MAG: hypothetical protein GEV13_16160 [Rhodospirillales bacterium]|nr:hypothetical protein [Rhodospirillales bacterium]
MMQQLMDIVTLEALGRDGQRLTRFKAAPARFELGGGPAVAAPGPVHELEGEVRCRKTTADDAVDVTRLFYDCYRYSYFNEQIYCPEALAGMMAKGDIDCIVAELPNGRLIGHMALIHHPDRPRAIEFGMAATNPSHRGHGVLAKLQHVANDEFVRSGKIVRFGGAVTARTPSRRRPAFTTATPKSD